MPTSAQALATSPSSSPPRGYRTAGRSECQAAVRYAEATAACRFERIFRRHEASHPACKRMTEQLYRTDAYLRDCTARVLAVNERGGIVLDRTVFYAAAGGQPGDKGSLEIDGGGTCPIATTVYDADKTTIVHVAAEGSARPAPGQTVRAVLDWDTRSKLMRMHTTLHLCARW